MGEETVLPVDGIAARTHGPQGAAPRVGDHRGGDGPQDAAAGGGESRAVENCDWPPGRWTKTTSSRATRRARSLPWSSSTRASARPIPALTPAEVR
ncbi:hypothetical protein AB0H90_19995 [Streptomyces paromomycinus]|nr:hypothetical protein [Streptomyces paromomycinus]